jgi:hypothetical protein
MEKFCKSTADNGVALFYLRPGFALSAVNRLDLYSQHGQGRNRRRAEIVARRCRSATAIAAGDAELHEELAAH